jgi:RNA polymerase sigma-70 factor (ECF subfamily)
MLALRPVAEDDPVPLDRLFREHHAALYRAAFRITGSPSDAEDVLQTVFLRLAKQGGQGLTPGAGPYLRRAAVNAALDVLRQRRTSRVVPVEVAEAAAPEALPPHEQAELRRALREAIVRLHPRAAEMFALRYLEGYDNGEIARQLETSAPVVAVTLHRARGRLQKDLRQFVTDRRKPG